MGDFIHEQKIATLSETDGYETLARLYMDIGSVALYGEIKELIRIFDNIPEIISDGHGEKGGRILRFMEHIV
jgi:hypothetical protein